MSKSMIIDASVSDVSNNKKFIMEWVLDFETAKQDSGVIGDYCSNANSIFMTKSFVNKIINGKLWDSDFTFKVWYFNWKK